MVDNATNGGTDSTGGLSSNTTVTTMNVSQLKAKVEAQFTALVNALDTELADVTEFDFASGKITKAELVARISSRIAAAENAKAARLSLHAAVAAEGKVAAEVAPYRRDVRNYLVTRYGSSNPILQKFGFTQAKAPQKSAAAKAQGVAKARATRQALGTKGKKQRKAAAKLLQQQAPAQPPAPAPSPSPAQPAAPVPKPGAVS